jgi:hypothetical protein
MSQAGARSGRGDEYQLRIAMLWIVRLWSDVDVISVQLESLGMPGDGVPPLIDDILVEFADKHREFIQAKKNHPEFGVWTLRDRTLRAELKKARDQLERLGSDAVSIVRFYSRSPFGSLHRLVEGARDYPDASTFLADAPETLMSELRGLAELWEREVDYAFELARRLEFSVTQDYDELDREVFAALRMHFARPAEVRDLLEERLRSHQARLRDAVPVFRKDDLTQILAARGHVPTPDRAEADILASFAQSSRIGRSWVREIAGVRIERTETRAILEAVQAGAGAVLVTGEPGIGKTCVLLDVADVLGRDALRALLFIKGDRFSGARSEAELAERGLPDDIVGRCARLAVYRPVVVIIDALDVLSLQRAGGTLGVFLGLMDRLEAIPGVTIIAACRSFDVEFDPLLRGRSWDTRIKVGALSIDQYVVPILAHWGIRSNRLDSALLELLRVAGHLWLYGQIASSDAPIERVGSIYELHERYLEAIAAEPGWGAEGAETLVWVAARMQERRTLEVARSEIRASAEVIQGLLSRGVLVGTERGYAFGHQELVDVIAVRSAKQRAESVRDFVAAHPALPFLRPTVRVFLQVLRAESPRLHRREVWDFVSDEGLAYHLRRLAAESLGEIRPEPEDGALLRRLMSTYGDLFQRFLQRAVGESWIDMVVSELLPAATRAENAEQSTHWVLRHLATWVSVRPDIVIPTWRRALEEGWPGTTGLSWVIIQSLEKGLRETDRESVQWEDTEWLLRHLLADATSTEHDSYLIGPTVQAWVEAGGSDDLLLAFLDLEGTIEVSQNRLSRRVRSLRRRPDESAVPKEFLSSRMASSDLVMDAVLDFVLEVAADDSRGLLRGILHQTSWRGRHNQGILAHDAFNDILQGFEDALSGRAMRNDLWWQDHLNLLLSHQDAGIRYLALRALRCAPEENIETISMLLTQSGTFERGDLETEVRELAHAAYPFLSAEVSQTHQEILLSLLERGATDADDWMEKARRRAVHEHFISIPRPYRIAAAEIFLEGSEEEFGPYRPEPRVYMSGGWVAPPVAASQLEELSDTTVLRIIGFWGTTVMRDGGTDLVGGWDQLVGSVRDAAMNEPTRALRWLDALIEADAPVPYRGACMEGIALHLRARFGGLRPSGSWKPAEPMPDGGELGHKLIELLERHGGLWMGERALADAVLACTHVLDDHESAVRITVLLVHLSASSDPTGELGHDPPMEGLNSTRGTAATAAVILAGRVAEAGGDLPEVLSPLLHQFARDPRPGVRWAILYALPALTYSVPDLAWTLLDEAAQDAGSHIWDVAERSLYYHYHRDFDRVRPVLERIRTSALDEAGEVYGRIAALAYLAGQLSEDRVFGTLANDPSPVWAGLTQVFVANLLDSAHRFRCEEALVRLLASPGVPDAVHEEVTSALGRDEVRAGFSRRIVETLVGGAPDREEYSFRAHSILEWAAEEVVHDALGVLGVLERLAAGFETGHFRGLHGGGNLLPPLPLSCVRRTSWTILA